MRGKETDVVTGSMVPRGGCRMEVGVDPRRLEANAQLIVGRPKAHLVVDLEALLTASVQFSMLEAIELGRSCLLF